ncbi:MAG: polysaccharide export protein [Kiritimatiellae bacterium]|nr:polysaccharide export protein [Kiritimatiellia bacterium]
MKLSKLFYLASVGALCLLQACASPRSSSSSTGSRYRTGSRRTYGTTSTRRPASTETASSRPSLRASAPGVTPDRTAAAYVMKQGDAMVIYLRGIPREEMIEDIIDDAGMVTLPFLNDVEAAGKTASELERSIRRAYVERAIYKDVSVNVVLPSQSYYVRGEVRVPGRFPLMSGVTVVQAIATAGGYTEFANPRKVNILRGGKVKYVDVRALERHPEKDIPIEAGDVIVVPRSVF